MRLTETRNLSLVFLFSSFSFSKLRPYFLSKLIPPICQPLSLNPEAWHSFGYPLAFEISIFSVPYALFSKSRKLFRSVTSKLRTFFLTLIFLQNPCGIFLKKKKKSETPVILTITSGTRSPGQFTHCFLLVLLKH